MVGGGGGPGVALLRGSLKPRPGSMFAAPARAEETPCCNKVSSAAPLPRPPPRAAAGPRPASPPGGRAGGGRPLPPTPPRRPWSTSPSSPRLAGRRGAPRCRRKVTRGGIPPRCGSWGRSAGSAVPRGLGAAACGGFDELRALSACSARPAAPGLEWDALGHGGAGARRERDCLHPGDRAPSHCPGSRR